MGTDPGPARGRTGDAEETFHGRCSRGPRQGGRAARGDVIRVLLEQHARIKAAEAFAPTHPHPNADPGSTKQKLVGPFASMVDRVKDALSKAV